MNILKKIFNKENMKILKENEEKIIEEIQEENKESKIVLKNSESVEINTMLKDVIRIIDSDYEIKEINKEIYDQINNIIKGKKEDASFNKLYEVLQLNMSNNNKRYNELDLQNKVESKEENILKNINIEINNIKEDVNKYIEKNNEKGIKRNIDYENVINANECILIKKIKEMLTKINNTKYKEYIYETLDVLIIDYNEKVRKTTTNNKQIEDEVIKLLEESKNLEKEIREFIKGLNKVKAQGSIILKQQYPKFKRLQEVLVNRRKIFLNKEIELNKQIEINMNDIKSNIIEFIDISEYISICLEDKNKSDEKTALEAKEKRNNEKEVILKNMEILNKLKHILEKEIERNVN